MNEIEVYHRFLDIVENNRRNLTKQDVFNVYNCIKQLSFDRRKKIYDTFEKRLGMVTMYGSKISILTPNGWDIYKAFVPCLKAETEGLSYILCTTYKRFDTLAFLSEGIYYKNQSLNYKNYLMNTDQMRSEIKRFWDRFDGSDCDFVDNMVHVFKTTLL